MLASTRDPDGRRIVLTAVHEPTVRQAGRFDGEVWYFLEDAGPFRWLKVVVHYEGGEGWIVTAFPRRSPPS